MPREEFKPGARFGVSVVDEFSWKDLLDFTACTECGRCNQNCPATSTGKPLNPRLLVHDGKVNLLTNGSRLLQGNRSEGLMPLIGKTDEHQGTIGEDALWACTTCGACMTNCPVFIEHVPKIIKMRRHLVENEASFPHELAVFFESVEQRSNPWGITPGDRAKWARDLAVPLMSEARCDTLFFVGCAGAFDARNKKVATAVVRALKAAGVQFAILGTEEKCCGDSVRRLGNEYLFERMANTNVELFKKYDVRRIITYCPHCYTTLKHDYHQFGMNMEVRHHSEFLHELLETGRLKLDGDKPVADGKVLYHDSCYLGRYNGLYEEPREVVRRVTGRKPLEMDRRLEKSFCCGAGGGRMWMEEEPEHRINANRVREALGKDADVVAVACPYCMTMFDDGIKDEHAEGRVKVMDIAELVAARLPG
ncbi:MAG: succinate dehydrogenase/fumarate reductase iron-sulfur subunit [Candidatus Latescibacteria bacterium ADurb.Bin168]|nr:MAG: succinate dehydrogenase/fumarate reductase iron-sulfur subunit [Candidatus Latescibacteria bacterium ADurb.Bin168]